MRGTLLPWFEMFALRMGFDACFRQFYECNKCLSMGDRARLARFTIHAGCMMRAIRKRGGYVTANL